MLRIGFEVSLRAAFHNSAKVDDDSARLKIIALTISAGLLNHYPCALSRVPYVPFHG
jgi:hypothetical protein